MRATLPAAASTGTNSACSRREAHSELSSLASYCSAVLLVLQSIATPTAEVGDGGRQVRERDIVSPTMMSE